MEFGGAAIAVEVSRLCGKVVTRHLSQQRGAAPLIKLRQKPAKNLF
jgi:hypothetical protein